MFDFGAFDHATFDAQEQAGHSFPADQADFDFLLSLLRLRGAALRRPPNR
jgi:hypothetical protein